MRTLTIVTESVHSWGAERSLRQLLKGGIRDDFDVRVVVSDGSPLLDELRLDGVNAREHRFARHPALTISGSFSDSTLLQKIQELPSILAGAGRLRGKLWGSDLVLCFSLWQLPETILASRLIGAPVVFDLHETFGGALAAKVMPLLLSRVNRVIAPSEYVVRRASYDPRLCAIIPRPVSDSRIGGVVDSRASSITTVGMFGQIASHKRVLPVVKALEGEPVRLLIVGGSEPGFRTDYELEVRDAIAARKDGSRVVDRVDDIRPLMGECHFVVNASEHEAFGRSVVEAASLGTVPVVLEDSGPAECVRDLDYGVVLEGLKDLADVVGVPLSVREERRMKFDSDRLRRYEPLEVARQYSATMQTVMKEASTR